MKKVSVFVLIIVLFLGANSIHNLEKEEEMGFYDRKNPQIMLSLYAAGLDYIKKRNPAFWHNFFSSLRKELDIYVIEVALYSLDEDNVFKNQVPWFQDEDETFDLDYLDRDFWKGWREFANICQAEKIKLRMIPIFGRRAERPFKNNVNAVYGIFDDRALKYQKRVIKKIKGILEKREVLYDWRLSNEFGRGWSKADDVRMNNFHEEWFKATGADIRRVCNDVTYNDFLHFCEEEWLLDDNSIVRPDPAIPESRIIGKMGHDEWNRLSWIQHHGYGIVDDLEGNESEGRSIWQALLGSAWKGFELSSDGVCSGSIKYPDLWGVDKFSDSTYQELYDLCVAVWKEGKRKRKAIRIIDLPKGVFFKNKKGKIEECFELIYCQESWNRLRAFKDAWNDLKKE